MTSLLSMRNVLLAGVLLFAGCKIDGTDERAHTEGLHHHNWWNYYEAGKLKLNIGDFKGARADFETCLGLRPGATYAFPKEMWRVRTYGLHMLDAYFPHRELGIVLFQLGDMKNAEQYLEKSLLQEPSGRAKFYLNLVRKKLIAGQPLAAPQVILDKDVAFKWTKQRKRVLSGLAQSKAFVSGVKVNEHPEFIELAEQAIRFEREIQLSPGTNIVRIEVKDLADNVVTHSVVWIADWQPPQIVIKRVDKSGKLWKVQGVCYDDTGLACLNTDGHAQTFLESERIVSIPLEFAMDPDRSMVVYAEDLAGNHVQAVLSAPTLTAQCFPFAGKQFASAGLGRYSGCEQSRGRARYPRAAGFGRYATPHVTAFQSERCDRCFRSGVFHRRICGGWRRFGQCHYQWRRVASRGRSWRPFALSIAVTAFGAGNQYLHVDCGGSGGKPRDSFVCCRAKSTGIFGRGISTQDGGNPVHQRGGTATVRRRLKDRLKPK